MTGDLKGRAQAPPVTSKSKEANGAMSTKINVKQIVVASGAPTKVQSLVTETGEW